MTDRADIPPEFEAALLSLRGHTLRKELWLEEVPAPTRIAPYAAALTGEVNPTREPEDLIGSGRFVILYDPEGQPAWNGPFRLIVMARASLDPEIAADGLLGRVAWSWLGEALEESHADFHSLSGTVSRVVNESFGEMHYREGDADIEIRASWSPQDTNLAPHLRAWALLMCQIAGLPPSTENVTHLRPNF